MRKKEGDMIALGELRKLLDRLPYGAGLFTSEGEGAFKYFNDNYYRLTGTAGENMQRLTAMT